MKSLIVVILVILFSGCLLSSKKMNTNLNISDKSKIDSSYTSGEYSYGGSIEIPIIVKEDIEGVSFDIVYNKSKFDLVKITRKGISEENLTMAYVNNTGSKVIVYDMKQKIVKGNEFIRVYFNVKGTGKESITINNIKTK